MTSTVNYKTHWHQNFVTYWESLYASSIRKTFGLTSPRCCRLNLSFLTPTFPHWQAVCVITGLVQSPFPGQSALMPLTLNLSPLQMPLSNLVHVLSRSCRCLLSIISIVRSIIWFRHPRRPGNTRIKAEFTDPTLRPASTNQQFLLHQCQTSSSLSTAQLDNFQSLFPFSHLQNSTPTPVGKFGWELQQRHPNSSFPGLLCVFNVCTRNKISAR